MRDEGREARRERERPRKVESQATNYGGGGGGEGEGGDRGVIRFLANYSRPINESHLSGLSRTARASLAI